MIGQPGEGAASSGAGTGLRAERSRRGRDAKRFDALLHLVSGAIAQLDPYDRIIAWNSAAEQALGWRGIDVAGRDFVQTAAAPEQRDAVRDVLARVRAEGNWEGRVTLRRPDGAPVLCAMRARAIHGDDGAILAAFAEAGSESGEMAGAEAAGESRTDAGTGTAGESGADVGPGPAGESGADVGPGPAGESGAVVVAAGAAGESEAAAHEDRAALLNAERAARSELEYVRDRLAYVVHASSRLASSLDVGMTLETVGFLVVPRFGQLCIIDLWDGRRLDRVFVHDAAADMDPARQALVEEIRKLGGLQRDDHPAVRAVLSGRPAVVTTTTSDVAATMYDDPSGRLIVEQATQGQGFVSVPLITRGRVIGVLTLLGPGRAYGRALAPGEDLPVLEQVANRAAQSIENARLFDAERRLARSLQESERRQRRAALTLQRSLLPAWTHQPGELEVATRYFPGAEEAEVGGDWYDVMPVGFGRTALVIGDVMGRGLRAATLMGQVRTAVRAYARQDLAPKEILDLLDGVVADLGEAEIVTCVYAVFDRMRGTLTYASAGHLPLLVVDRRNRARRLDHQAGLPLGVGRCAAPEHVVQVQKGTTVAFYTDGLVEHRRRDVDSGIDELVDALARASGTLDGLCDQIIDALRPPAGYDDDVALLLARPRDPT